MMYLREITSDTERLKVNLVTLLDKFRAVHPDHIIDLHAKISFETLEIEDGGKILALPGQIKYELIIKTRKEIMNEIKA